MKTLPSDPFLRGYLLAAMFTEDPEPVGGQFEASGRPESLLPRIPEDFLSKATADCAAFQTSCDELLLEACGHDGYDMENAGMDFLYSRNSHGVGYWDRDLGRAGDALHESAKAMGEHCLDFND